MLLHNDIFEFANILHKGIIQMKKNYNAIIIRTWIISFIGYFISSAIYLFGSWYCVEHFDLYWGFMLLAPLAGFIIGAPVILRQENIRQHFERKLEKEKAHH